MPFFRYVNPDLTRQTCAEKIKKDLSLVTIEIAVPEMVLLTRDISISLADKIGLAGEYTIHCILHCKHFK